MPTLNDKEIWQLARLCRQEQGTIAGIKAEMSLILNRFNAYSKYDSIIEYVIKSKWWAKAEHWMNEGYATQKDFEAVKEVLDGHPTLPYYVDEHDCFTDIEKITTDGVEGNRRVRDDYVKDKTIIKNRYGSKYTFYCFPDAYSDPFGYTGYIDMPEKKTPTALQVLAVARAWLGLKESDGSHRTIINIYNAHKPLPRGYKVQYTDAWCATYVSAVAIEAGAENIIPIECGCEEMIEKAKAMGIWVEDDSYTPSPGDIIMYDWQDSGAGDNKGHADHTGYVNGVSPRGTIEVLEGNKNDSVSFRYINVDDMFIRGYIVPKYSEGAAQPVPESKYTFSVESVQLGSKGNLVLLLAEILKARRFYNQGLAPDMTCDEQLVKAINAYQSDRRKQGVELGTDGHNDSVCGKKMWADVLAL